MRYEIRAMSVGAILDRSLRVYLQNFWSFLALGLIFAVPVALLFRGLEVALGEPRTDLDRALHSQVASGASMFANIILGGIVQGVLIQAVSDAYLGSPAGIGRCLRVALGRFLPILAAMFLLMVAVGAGSCACLVPGVYLTGALFAMVPVVVLERRGPIEALRRSWSLTEGGRWRAVGAIFFAQLGGGLVAGGLAVVLEFNGVPPLATQSYAQVAQAVFMPYVIVVTILLYYDTRVRREAFDLQILAREAGRAPAPAPAP